MIDLHKTRSKKVTGALLPLLAGALCSVGCKNAPTPPPQDDASLTQAAQSKIVSDSSLSADAIQASVQGGVATLTGTASNEATRSLAANDAAQVAGIRTVVNDLTISASAVAPFNFRTTQPQVASIVPPPVLTAPRVLPLPRHIKRAASITQPTSANPAPSPEQAETYPPAPIERSTPRQLSKPATPERRSFTIPADTTLPIRLSQTLDTASTREGDPFAAVLDSDILIDGAVVLHKGTAVTGHVDTVQEATHFKGSSLLVIQLTSLQDRGSSLLLSTDAYSKAGNGRGKNSAAKIGGGAAVGAILGGIFGGGKGAAIGAAAGGGAGAGAQAITRGQQVQIPAESLIRFRLTSPVEIRLPSTPERSSEIVPQRNN